MRIEYDPEVDVLEIFVSDVPVAYSEDNEQFDTIVHYDEHDGLVSLELLFASRRAEELKGLDLFMEAVGKPGQPARKAAHA
jgi:uncharacterized protein YuzE